MDRFQEYIFGRSWQLRGAPALGIDQFLLYTPGVLVPFMVEMSLAEHQHPFCAEGTPVFLRFGRNTLERWTGGATKHAGTMDGWCDETRRNDGWCDGWCDGRVTSSPWSHITLPIAEHGNGYFSLALGLTILSRVIGTVLGTAYRSRSEP